METDHCTREELDWESLFGLDIEDLIKYRKEIQRDEILEQVEDLESKFSHCPDGSEEWIRFISQPIIDQYGQVWMIWKNHSTKSPNPEDCYQIYVIESDSKKFKFAIVDDVQSVDYSKIGTKSYEFSVGRDKSKEPIILNVVFHNQVYQMCPLYDQQREIKRATKTQPKQPEAATNDMSPDKIQKELGSLAAGSLATVA